jgi:hypothetical protein
MQIHTTCTGCLVLSKVTPAIAAIFGGYGVTEDAKPEGGRVDIYRRGTPPSSKAVLDGVLNLSSRMRCDRSIPAIVQALRGSPLDAAEVEFTSRLEYVDDGEEFFIHELYSLAKILDDGHGIRGISLQGSWWSDNDLPGEPGEYGGEMTYIDDRVHARSATDAALRDAESLSAAISNSTDSAVDRAYERVNGFLKDIRNPSLRDDVALGLANRLCADLASKSRAAIPDEQRLYIRSMGKLLRVTAVALTDDAANAHMARHDNDALVAIVNGLRLMADKHDPGQDFDRNARAMKSLLLEAIQHAESLPSPPAWVGKAKRIGYQPDY